MSYADYDVLSRWWTLIAGMVIFAIIVWATLGIWHAVNTPPMTGINKAREEFVNQCKLSQGKSGIFENDYKYAIPNTGSDDASKWTCEFPK